MSSGDDHHHCKVCGAVCDPSELVCSPACQEKRDAKLRTGKMLQYAMYGAMLFLLFTLAIGLHAF